MRSPPKSQTAPDQDLLEAGQPAWSASLNPTKSPCPLVPYRPFLNDNPKSTVPFRYRRTLLVYFHTAKEGLEINLQSCPTAKDMSGLGATAS